MPSSLLSSLSVVFYLHTCLASPGEDLFVLGQSSANALLPRARGGGRGGGGSYYKSCQESYGSGFAECYGTCYNAGAGEKCCAGNYSCPNGQYCGFGSYSYCCYDYKSPAECAGQYAIAQPPPNWKPGDGNAPASVTNPPAPTNTPTATAAGDNDATQPTAAGPSANVRSSNAGNANTVSIPTSTSSASSSPTSDFSFTRQTLSTSDLASGAPTTGFGGVSNNTAALGGDATASQTSSQLVEPSLGSGGATGASGGPDRVDHHGIVWGVMLAIFIAVMSGLGLTAA